MMIETTSRLTRLIRNQHDDDDDGVYMTETERLHKKLLQFERRTLPFYRNQIILPSSSNSHITKYSTFSSRMQRTGTTTATTVPTIFISPKNQERRKSHIESTGKMKYFHRVKTALTTFDDEWYNSSSSGKKFNRQKKFPHSNCSSEESHKITGSVSTIFCKRTIKIFQCPPITIIYDSTHAKFIHSVDSRNYHHHENLPLLAKPNDTYFPEHPKKIRRSYELFRKAILYNRSNKTWRLCLKLSHLKTFRKISALKYFRRWVKLIIICLRAISYVKQNRRRVTVEGNEIEEEISQLQGMDTNSSIGIFDLSYFRRPKERQLSKEVKYALTLPPTRRTGEQINNIVLDLTQSVQQFAEFPINMQQELAKRSYYDEFGANRVILRQGHYADNFYLILSGKTVVTITKTNEENGTTETKDVAFLKKGDTFGELALMSGAKRNATVSCCTSVTLLTLDRSAFVDIFMHYEKGSVPSHIRFLHKVEYIKHWPIAELPYDKPNICLFTYFKKGTVMCKNSTNSEWLYIVKSGHCRILKLLDAPKINKTKASVKLLKKQATTKSRKFGRQSKLPTKLPPIKKEIQKPQERHVKDEKKPERIYVHIQTLSEGNVFGLHDIVFGSTQGSMPTTLISDGTECILINRKFFTEHLSEKLIRRMRIEMTPLPTELELKRKFQEFIDWTIYKQKMKKSIPVCFVENNFHMYESSISIKNYSFTNFLQIEFFSNTTRAHFEPKSTQVLPRETVMIKGIIYRLNSSKDQIFAKFKWNNYESEEWMNNFQIIEVNLKENDNHNSGNVFLKTMPYNKNNSCSNNRKRSTKHKYRNKNHPLFAGLVNWVCQDGGPCLVSIVVVGVVLLIFWAILKSLYGEFGPCCHHRVVPIRPLLVYAHNAP
ncbi:hypothetical protein SNEBB_010395 [Seison nebaliae]|nr:hypothetical protein SNEBB_010395 [Seison nebaliae]